MLKSFFSFDTFVFPKIVTIIYWIGIAVIVIGTLGSLLTVMSNPYSSGMGVFGALAILVGGAVGIVAWRLVVEFWLVIFSIRDLLRDIRDQGRGV
tara:strand:+ start:1939 stop:2223 length:285 start_codon:yes stop_codon:yes gene_type:complete